MKTWMIVLCIMVVVVVGLGLATVSCGDEGCPGIVCSDCGMDGDCDVDCSGDQVEYCGHFGYFDDPDLRCAFCESPDFEF
ncbi:MAG: hypothetical protein JRF33_15840 [Deltaproteobacteria bacterium]|nr:hypothetical protein [Deltaproteobacteria bacterium]